MNATIFPSSLAGHIRVPGSKSHTIRALLLAALAEGTSTIKNPLPSADCLSTCGALPLLGARVDTSGTDWTVYGAGKNLHLPSDVVNVGDSGSLLYFLSPIAATFEGWSVFTGDELIRKRPVHHVVDALRQLGAEAHTALPQSSTCPLIIKGPISTKNKVVTGGTVSSQYISGLMMAALKLEGTLNIQLTDPKETPYLTMTRLWLEKIGAKVSMSKDFKEISVTAPNKIDAFNCTIPSDWEAIAFPLIAALISDSEIVIDDVDSSGTQGDDAIVALLKSVGADITWNKENNTLLVRGGAKAKDGIGRLSTENCAGGQLVIPISPFPDAVCALAVCASFIEGTTRITDAEVCRRKETDRIAVLSKTLAALGVATEEKADELIIHGHSKRKADGTENPAFSLHGGTVESYGDHRIAMAFSCMGMGLKHGESITVNGAECCSVSFPRFFEAMKGIGAKC